MRRCRQCLRVKPEGCFGKQAFDAGLAGRFCGPCALVRTVYCVHSMGAVTMLGGHFANTALHAHFELCLIHGRSMQTWLATCAIVVCNASVIFS